LITVTHPITEKNSVDNEEIKKKIQDRNNLTKIINTISMFLSPLQRSMCSYLCISEKKQKHTNSGGRGRGCERRGHRGGYSGFTRQGGFTRGGYGGGHSRGIGQGTRGGGHSGRGRGGGQGHNSWGNKDATFSSCTIINHYY